MANLVYSPHYNIHAFGFERWHPFDTRKYGRAWQALRARFGRALDEVTVQPSRPISHQELRTVHSQEYLRGLRSPAYLASALEVRQLVFVPWRVTDWCVLRPMRWATMGTVVAAREALSSGVAINLGGGFHHAKPDAGEGFCIYNDIAIAIQQLRAEQVIGTADQIAYIDLDAHQGNGVSNCFLEDRRVAIFDMFNADIYPALDRIAQARINISIPLTTGCEGEEYLLMLQRQLPVFLDELAAGKEVRLAVYNAGTDTLAGDPLGWLSLMPKHIFERDVYVIDSLRKRGIPVVMLTSGGYTKTSFQLIADSIAAILRRHGPDSTEWRN